MKVVYSDLQKAHYPNSFLVNDQMQPNPESPERCDVLLRGALAAGCELQVPVLQSLDKFEPIHSRRYLTFMENAWTRWQRIPGAADAVIPNIHPTSRQDHYPHSVVAQAGFHMSDLACPISDGSWESVLWSASAALHAADLVRVGDPMAYSLCRPPGHHAAAEIAGGFCYLNNAALAAQSLRSDFSRVAILDVDLHHGNGTQQIFYQRADVMTVSLHADPARFYPFFWGAADETGVAEGTGFNLNLPLPRGSGDETFLDALKQALNHIHGFQPEALVISLGLDAYSGDPFAGLSISTEGFGQIARRIVQALPIPTVLVQEGGYLCDELGDNLATFLSEAERGSGIA